MFYPTSFFKSDILKVDQNQTFQKHFDEHNKTYHSCGNLMPNTILEIWYVRKKIEKFLMGAFKFPRFLIVDDSFNFRLYSDFQCPGFVSCIHLFEDVSVNYIPRFRKISKYDFPSSCSLKYAVFVSISRYLWFYSLHATMS